MKIKHLSVLFLVATLIVNAQNLTEDPTVAVVGDKTVEASEYIQRFEFVPKFLADSDSVTPAVRKKFLYTLIAEKLWAKKAEELSLDTTVFVQTAVNAFEKLLVRDALYRNEVSPSLQITGSELNEGLHKFKTILRVKLIHEKSREQIIQDYQILKEGFPFDSLLTARGQISKANYAEIRFGDLPKNIEDKLYELRVGNYTEPIRTPNGWNIFYLADKYTRTPADSREYQTAVKKVKKIIDSRRTKSSFERFYEKFFSEVNARANGKLLVSLSGKMEKIFRNKMSLLPKDTINNKIQLDPQDALKIERQFGKDSLNSEFIVFENDEPVKLKEFLRELSFWGFHIKESRIDSVVYKLNGKVKEYIQQEMLAREGYDRGLDKLPRVRKDLSIWRDHYLALAYRKYVTKKSYEEGEIRSLLSKSPVSPENFYETKIYEAQLDNETSAEKLFQEAVRINDLKTAAEQFEETKIISAGYSKFYSSAENVISEKAETMEAGEISSPIKKGNSHIIFQVLEKNEVEANTKLSVKKSSRNNGITEILNNSTVELANQYGFKLYEDVLKKLDLSSINTLIYRRYGFGGKTTAVPITRPFNNWIEQYQNQQELP